MHFPAWGGWREKQGGWREEQGIATLRRRATDLRIPATVSGGEPNEAKSSAGGFVYRPFTEFAHQELTSRPEFLPYFASFWRMNARGIQDHDFERWCSKD